MLTPQQYVDYQPPVKRKKKDNWELLGFRENEIQFNRNHIVDELEKYKLELKNDILNNKHTTVLPTYVDTVENILTLIGFTESAKRDTGETSTTISHMSLGDQTSPTTPAEGDTDLEQEITGGTPTYARLAFSTDGQAKVVNQTAKYGMLWDDGDIDVTPAVNITEVGLHWHLSDASKMHARITPTTFTFDAGDLFVVQMNELMANA